MSQQRFDTADFLVSNKAELFHTLEPELASVLEMKPWFQKQDLELSYEDAFADWLVYKVQWAYIDSTGGGKSFEEVATTIDKSFLVDLFGESVLKSATWEKQ